MSEHGFVFSEKPIRIDHGQGAYLYDGSGTEYLDVGASYACTPAGHCHPRVVEAVTEQMRRLVYVQGSYPLDVRDRLEGRLVSLAPGDLRKVWLCNSGTEANEAAIKFARSATGRSTIVAATRGFHGRTLGSLAATWKPAYREGFEPLAGGVEFVEYGDPEAISAAVDEDTAAVLVEPIQGEGGVNPAPSGYLEAVREHTADAGAAMIVDEIQTGLGRTGEWWGIEHHGVAPDILTTAKGLANGLPIGATLCREWVADGAGDHGSTFSGGPVISAAATATLDVIESESLASHAAELGARLKRELTDRLGDAVRAIRGRGLMLGIEVKRGANRLLRELALDHHVLALPAGRTVLRLLPPLILDRTAADRTADAIESVLTEGGDGA